MENRARAALEQVVIDPTSFLVRNISAGNDEYICGQVNAKNRMGAYVGFVPFLITKDGSVMIAEQGVSLTAVDGKHGRFATEYVLRCGTLDQKAALSKAMEYSDSINAAKQQPIGVPIDQSDDDAMNYPLNAADDEAMNEPLNAAD